MFPGGTARSFKSAARLTWSSFRWAIDRRLLGHLFLAAGDSVPSNRSSVPLSLKDCITHHVIQYNAATGKRLWPYNIELSSRAESNRESQFCRQPEETVEVGIAADCSNDLLGGFISHARALDTISGNSVMYMNLLWFSDDCTLRREVVGCLHHLVRLEPKGQYGHN